MKGLSHENDSNHDVAIGVYREGSSRSQTRPSSRASRGIRLRRKKTTHCCARVAGQASCRRHGSNDTRSGTESTPKVSDLLSAVYEEAPVQVRIRLLAGRPDSQSAIFRT